MAAFEAQFRTGRGDFTLFGLPNAAAERVDLQIAVPGALSFLIHDDVDEPVMGLDRFRPADRPPVVIPFVLAYTAVVYWTFRGKVRVADEGY